MPFSCQDPPRLTKSVPTTFPFRITCLRLPVFRPVIFMRCLSRHLVLPLPCIAVLPGSLLWQKEELSCRRTRRPKREQQIIRQGTFSFDRCPSVAQLLRPRRLLGQFEGKTTVSAIISATLHKTGANTAQNNVTTPGLLSVLVVSVGCAKICHMSISLLK